MKLKVLFISILSSFFFFSCSDDVINDLVDSVISFGDAKAKVDGVQKDFSNYAGYRTTGNSTALYFADFEFKVTQLDVKGHAILSFMHTDLFNTEEGIEINLATAPEIALDPKKALGAALYLSNVSAQDLYDLIVEYNKNQNLAAVIQLAGQKDVTIQRVTAADIVTNLDPSGNITFNFTKMADNKVSGTFSFKAYGDDDNVAITEGTFTDTPMDTFDFSN
ncbi:hypothetical protein [Flammeovirga pacifica]|uniref:Uncharacterized protein n=1 Tax=Flammeovirga pacifica TaxID=915059 RepID=A0A1S1Z355_FLAPC|nr:hypothetical protein [Flammeovirga pacifica]OHX67710.1 hypothetical protein NH26_15830 [Flammeovirga pacifica]